MQLFLCSDFLDQVYIAVLFGNPTKCTIKNGSYGHLQVIHKIRGGWSTFSH